MTLLWKAVPGDLRPAAGSRTAHHDPRWPAIGAALVRLRERHRHALRIVDADCGCGTLLIAAVAQARALGFTAIEGRGIAAAPTLIGRARAAAARVADPAIGLSFEVGEVIGALASEVEHPADILLWRDGRVGDALLRARLAAAAHCVIADDGARVVRALAA